MGHRSQPADRNFRCKELTVQFIVRLSTQVQERKASVERRKRGNGVEREGCYEGDLGLDQRS